MTNFQNRFLQQFYSAHKYPLLFVDVPSRGMVYNTDTFVYQTGKIASRKLDGKAEEWGAERILSGTGDESDEGYKARDLAVAELVGTYIEDVERLPMDDMLIADRDMLVFTHRIMSYGNEFVGIVDKCYSCGGHVNSHDATVDEISVEWLSVEPVVPGKNYFRWTDGTCSIGFRMKTVGIERELEEIEQGDFNTMARVAKLVIDVNGSTKNVGQRFSSLSITTAARFWDYVAKTEPYVHLITSDITCFDCKTNNKIDGPFSPGILPICSSQARKLADTQIYDLMKHVGYSYSDFFDMPIETRRRLYAHLVERKHEEAEAKAKSK